MESVLRVLGIVSGGPPRYARAPYTVGFKTLSPNLKKLELSPFVRIHGFKRLSNVNGN